jgi:hypothetical protein
MYQALAGLFVASVSLLAQAPVTSAEPGTLNYVEGTAYVDGQQVEHSRIGHINLTPNETLSTDSTGKAELLLTPGVFFRLGSNSEVRMVANSLTNTQLQLTRGEAFVDAPMLLKDNNVQILEQSASVKLLKDGLYRFDADRGQVAVFDGKIAVSVNDQKVEFGKGREVLLASAPLKAEKFDTKQHDSLYAWSNVRSEYAAEASYSAAKNINIYNYGGFGGGWLWNPWYSSWAFMPWSGYAYGPFGWGFFSPAYVRYAPVYYAPWRHAFVPVNVARVPSVAVRAHGFVRPGVSASVRPVLPARAFVPGRSMPMRAGGPMHR